MRIFLLLVFVMTPVCAAAEAVNDTRYGFQATLPSGFRRLPAGRPLPTKNTIHAFYVGDLSDDQPDVVIAFENLGGTIGRERLSGDSMPPLPGGAKPEFETTTWKSFEIDVVVVRMTQNGVRLTSLAAQVPLKPEAIQVLIAGPTEQEAELRSHLRTVLDSMEGNSNWLTNEERGQRFAEGAGRLVGAAIVVALVAGVIIVVRRNSRRRAQQVAYYRPYPPQYPPQQPPQEPPRSQ